MNRKYTRKKYLKIVKEFRKKVPHGILATDIIVGFPTETEKDFQDTLSLIKQIKFDFAYIFKYSLRPHTKAQKLTDNVPQKEKERRHSILLELQKEISRKKK
jgi:tRNA-2-methylthio-N6-dimethylallyladenosine synthase